MLGSLTGQDNNHVFTTQHRSDPDTDYSLLKKQSHNKSDKLHITDIELTRILSGLMSAWSMLHLLRSLRAKKSWEV